MVIKRSPGGESGGGGRSTSKTTCVVPAWTLTWENASFGFCASRWSHQLTSDPKRCLLFWSCPKAVSVPTFVIGGLWGSTATSALVLIATSMWNSYSKQASIVCTSHAVQLCSPWVGFGGSTLRCFRFLLISWTAYYDPEAHHFFYGFCNSFSRVWPFCLSKWPRFYFFRAELE